MIIYGIGIMCGIMYMNGCEMNKQDTKSMTIVETAQKTPDLSLLVKAVVRADLVDVLNSYGPFTVFAPTNAAFEELLESNNWNSIDEIPVETLTSVLLYHVVEGEVKADDLSDTYVNTLSLGPNTEPLSLQINVTGGIFFDGDASPIETDIPTINGIVHIINKVMKPNSLLDLIQDNPNFSILGEALTRPLNKDILFLNNFNNAYSSTLKGETPLTVFAPTNAAFQALLDSHPTWDSLDDIDDNTLVKVLNYHIYEGNVQSDQLTDGEVITMLGSGDITIDLSDGGVAIKTNGGNLVRVSLPDIQSTNGVIHVVDQVLIPQ